MSLIVTAFVTCFSNLLNDVATVAIIFFCFVTNRLEYLFTQISFLQGLLHWLGAVAVDMVLPKPTETASAKRMNKCLAGWLITLIISIMAFYNDHINFYSDYLSMIRRFLVLLIRKHRFRPMSLLYVPSFIISLILTWQAFTSPAKEDS